MDITQTISNWQEVQPVAGLIVVVGLFLMFALERFPPVVVAMAGVAFMLATDMLAPADLLAAFSNPAPITIAAFFILSGALIRTGAIDWMAHRMVLRAKDHPRQAMAGLLTAATVAPAFINNTINSSNLSPIWARVVPRGQRLLWLIAISFRRNSSGCRSSHVSAKSLAPQLATPQIA